jgi:hypothetical protein
MRQYSIIKENRAMLGRVRAWTRVMPTDIEPYAQLYTPRRLQVKASAFQLAISN